MLIGSKLAGSLSGLLLLAILTSLEIDAQSLPKGMGISEMKVSQLAGEVGPSGWPRFSFGEPALFTAVFPKPPQQQTNQFSGNDGSLSSWMFFAESETAFYQIVWQVSQEGPEVKSEKERRREYSNFAAGFFDGLVKAGVVKRGRVVANRTVSLNGMEGFEREFAFRDHEARLQMFHVGRSSLILASIWTSANPLAERGSFFSSVMLELGTAPSGNTTLKSP